jgi:hypothetical protein
VWFVPEMGGKLLRYVSHTRERRSCTSRASRSCKLPLVSAGTYEQPSKTTGTPPKATLGGSPIGLLKAFDR